MVGTVSGKEICLREYTYTVCLVSIGLTDCVTRRPVDLCGSDYQLCWRYNEGNNPSSSRIITN